MNTQPAAIQVAYNQLIARLADEGFSHPHHLERLRDPDIAVLLCQWPEGFCEALAETDTTRQNIADIFGDPDRDPVSRLRQAGAAVLCSLKSYFFERLAAEVRGELAEREERDRRARDEAARAHGDTRSDLEVSLDYYGLRRRA